MLLTVRNLSKSYGIVRVLRDISFVINPGDRAGIVGANGVGKSTLMKILVGQEEVDDGHLTYGPSVEFGYLPQTTPDFYGRTVEDLIFESVGNLRQLEQRMRELESEMGTASGEQLANLLAEYEQVASRFQDHGGYDLDYKIDTILAGLRINYIPRDREVHTLSGGERARLGLAILLLRSPDLLLLDEPTNHLDFASIEWLESYLSHYNGAMVMVSHDRQFLNRAVNHIFEIDDHSHQLKRYEGNYDAYTATKAAERQKWEEDYERQQEEIHELRKRIKEASRHVGHSYRAPRDNDKFASFFFAQRKDVAVSRNIRAAEEQLKRLEEEAIAKPPELLRVSSHFHGNPMQSQVVIKLAGLAKSFGERKLFTDLNLTVGPKERMMLVGPNGAGKTTLLNLIMGLEQPDSGEVQIVSNARIGYLAQDPALLDLSKTVIETYREAHPAPEGELIGRLLGYGLFRLEDMQKQAGQLSVGQRRKLEIACLMARTPNVLLLDEPTNYISLDVLEAFESAVLTFPGPVLAISHDRLFIERFGGEVWDVGNGQIVKREENAVPDVVR